MTEEKELCECGHSKKSHLTRKMNPNTFEPEGEWELGFCNRCINPRKENNWSHISECKKFKLKK